MWKKIGIGLGVLVGLVVVLIIVLVVGTRGAIVTGGVPLGGVTFTAGDIQGMPVYPGATQSTESKGVSVPDDMRRVIGTKDDQWKRYLTNAAPADVLAWYDKAMSDAGLGTARPRESGVMVFAQGDTRYAVYVTLLQGQTNIILASGKE